MLPPPLALLALAVCLAASPAPAQQTAPPGPPAVTNPPAEPAKVPFEDAEHKHFFRYQKHLRAIGLQGETKDSWNKLPAAEQQMKLAQGESFLRAKYVMIMRNVDPSPEDKALLKAVWGEELSRGMDALHKAAKVGDPTQIKAAMESLKKLQEKQGGALDLAGLFDGAKNGAGEEPLPDVLAPKKADAGFLASLSTPEVRHVLASRQSFMKFLEQKQVPPVAIPGLDAMYGVLSRAKSPEKEEIGHILPTVVKFLLDGKTIALEQKRGVLGMAVPGDYDRPERVIVTPTTQEADPTVIAMVLTHEFQHIHDMYAGRYYTLDSELRGFKSEVIFMRAMRSDPGLSKKLDQLANSDDDSTRGIIRDQLQFAEAYDRSPTDFANSVAFGHNYNNYEEGTFSGRLPLREAVDPRTGVVRQLAAQQGLLIGSLKNAVTLEKRQAEIRAQRDANPSRELDKELEKVTKDLAAERARITRLDAEVTIGEIRLRRMQSEAAWLDRRAAATGQQPPPYDLELPVDAEYVTP